MHLILFNFFRMVVFFLILSVLVGVLLGNFFGNNENLAKRLLVLSAGFLIAVCVVEVFPQIYNSGNENIGLWVIIGVVLQMVLEGMTKGFEHGHFHYEKCNILPVGLLVGMFIHAFIEGIPLAGMHLDSPYLLGILVHNLPISVVPAGAAGATSAVPGPAARAAPPIPARLDSAPIQEPQPTAAHATMTVTTSKASLAPASTAVTVCPEASTDSYRDHQMRAPMG